MSFLDRFKPQPRWKHTDPAVRLEAVPTIPDDDEHLAVLQELARQDVDVRVRRAAGDRLTRVEDLVLLEGLVNVDENAEFIETLTWGRTYLHIVRWFTTAAP